MVGSCGEGNAHAFKGIIARYGFDKSRKLQEEIYLLTPPNGAGLNTFRDGAYWAAQP
jgi:hypothetical protein